MMPEWRDTGSDSERVRAEICIAIDPRGISRAALEVVVTVAALSQASLLALLMEDLLLQGVGQWPSVTEVMRATGEERQLRVDPLRRQQRHRRRQIESLLDECAQARQVLFRLEDSDRPVSVATLAQQLATIYVPGKRRDVEGGAARGAVERIKLFYDHSAPAQRAAQMAVSLVAAGQCQEVVLVNLRSLPASLLAELTGLGARVYLHNQGGTKSGLLSQIVGGVAADLVLVPAPLVAGTVPRLLQERLENSLSLGTLLVS